MTRARRDGARALALALGFPALAWLFAGVLGLAIGLTAVVAWLLLNPPRAARWAVPVALLAVTPMVLFAEGLPSSEVVGPQFGLRHLAAHRLAVSALILAAFAALVELAGGHRPVIRSRP